MERNGKNGGERFKKRRGTEQMLQNNFVFCLHLRSISEELWQHFKVLVVVIPALVSLSPATSLVVDVTRLRWIKPQVEHPSHYSPTAPRPRPMWSQRTKQFFLISLQHFAFFYSYFFTIQHPFGPPAPGFVCVFEH